MIRNNTLMSLQKEVSDRENELIKLLGHTVDTCCNIQKSASKSGKIDEEMYIIHLAYYIGVLDSITSELSIIERSIRKELKKSGECDIPSKSSIEATLLHIKDLIIEAESCKKTLTDTKETVKGLSDARYVDEHTEKIAALRNFKNKLKEIQRATDHS